MAPEPTLVTQAEDAEKEVEALLNSLFSNDQQSSAIPQEDADEQRPKTADGDGCQENEDSDVYPGPLFLRVATGRFRSVLTVPKKNRFFSVRLKPYWNLNGISETGPLMNCTVPNRTVEFIFFK